MCFKITISNQREVQSDNNRKFTYNMVCISYKKNTNKVKQSEVQTDMPQKVNYFTQCEKQDVKNRVKFKQTCPRSSTTSHSAKNNTSKTEWSSNRRAREVQLLHAVHFHSQWRQKSWSRHFSNLLQNDRNIICVSSSPRSEKVKKILWERYVQQESFV